MSHSTPPKMAESLLNKWLPNRIKDDIVGDLTEEFYQSNAPIFIRNLKFWQQSFFACWNYPMNRNTAFSLYLTLLSLVLVYVLIRSMVFLSSSDDPLFYKDYWSNGDIHMFFFEPAFWSNLYGVNSLELNWLMLLNPIAIYWTGLVLSGLYWSDKKFNLSKSNYLSAVLVALFAPYFYGYMKLKFNNIPLDETGPIIAYMWSSIMYLLLPLCVLTIKKFNQQSKMKQD
jgi:hypothetical protein